MMPRAMKKTRKWPDRLMLSLLTAAVLAGTPIQEADAQQVGPGRIQEILTQAESLYEELLPIAQRIGDPAVLERMRSLRTQWVEARGHLMGRRYQMAQRMAQMNLDQLRQVGSVIRSLAQRLPYYERMAERNREVLRLLQQTVGASGGPEVQQRLTLSARIMNRAENAHSRGNLVQAFRMMEQAELMMRQMLRQMDQGSLTREAVDLEIQETARRMEQLEASGTLSGPALEAFTRARTLQREAQQALASGALRLALTRTLTARSAIRLAAALGSGRLDEEEVAAAIQHAEDLMDTYGALSSSDTENIRSLWNQASRQLERARADLASGKLRPAFEGAQSAAKLVLTAARRAGISSSEPPPDEAMDR